MLPYLNSDSPFPRVDQALIEPNGLLAAGADLSPSRLLHAYAKGIFPWYSPGEPILWWSPDPRTVFFINNFKVHRSVKRTLLREGLSVTINHDFEKVMHLCAAPRSDMNGTWITEKMINAYTALHYQGDAHSVEVWKNENLVGGIYGVVTGGVFCGESMFSRISNGSKIALSCLAIYLKAFGFRLIDCQVENPHLVKLGSSTISRQLYLQMLTQTRHHQVDSVIWNKQQLDWQRLLDIKTSV